MFNNDMVFYLVSQTWNTTQCANVILIMKSIWIVLVKIMLKVVFLSSSHYLEIELSRYNNTDRNERKCKLCNSYMVESEYQFLLCCPIYYDLRREYNMRCNWPNLTCFKNLLSSQNCY